MQCECSRRPGSVPRSRRLGRMQFAPVTCSTNRFEATWPAPAVLPTGQLVNRLRLVSQPGARTESLPDSTEPSTKRVLAQRVRLNAMEGWAGGDLEGDSRKKDDGDTSYVAPLAAIAVGGLLCCRMPYGSGRRARRPIAALATLGVVVVELLTACIPLVVFAIAPMVIAGMCVCHALILVCKIVCNGRRASRGRRRRRRGRGGAQLRHRRTQPIVLAWRRTTNGKIHGRRVELRIVVRCSSGG